VIELSKEQGQALAAAKEIPPMVLDPESRETYVLVKSAVFDRIKLLLRDDDVALSKREVAVLVERAMKEYDADDPTLELYQHD